MKKLLLLPVMVLLLTAIHLSGNERKSGDMSSARGLTTFSAIVKELELNYVDTIDRERAFREAIDALLETVDPYTVYYPEENREDISQMTTGEYGGIGAYLVNEAGGVCVSEPMEESPALAAGLKAGDRFIRVDTVDVSSYTSDKITKLLRGRPDTQVRVRVIRPYVSDSVRDITITRARLRSPSVPYSTVINGKTGYIRISQFIENTGKEVRAVLDTFKSRHPDLTGIIIDLRGNGGGLLEQSVDVAANFVPKGTEIIRTVGRDKDNSRTYKTMRNPLYPDIPLAVLIDGSTASASEILAGAMQDLDRGILLGSRSFGKGLVQTTRPLPYGGVLKVTVAKYYTPSGRLIQALDYQHRNEDGSAARVPDSLTHEYKTLHGRTIRDGGGLAPDSVIDWPKVNRLVYNAVSDNWIWRYANKYASTHPSIPPADKFVVTDSIYSDFKASIDPAKFKYDSTMESATEQLRNIARDEGYINDETTAAFDNLKKLLTHNLDRDFDTHRPQVEEYLGSEIVSRYYPGKGRNAYTVRDDKAIATAISIMGSPLYKKMLRPATVATKTDTRR